MEAQENSAQTETSPGDILRVKQGTDPADALLLACKRIRPDQTAAEPGPEPAEPSIENSVFKLVSTVASQDTPVQTHVREALSHPRLAHHALRPSQGSSQRIIGDLRSVQWSTRGEESYPILSSHRTGLSAEPPAPREMEAQENSAQTETSPGDILRVKQGTDPADALLLACKRIRPDQTAAEPGPEPAEPSIENSVFKLVSTVASQDTPVQTHVREALSHPRLAHHALRPSQGSSQRIIGDLRSVQWSTRGEESYPILSSHRTGLSAEPPAPREMEAQENSAQTETSPGDILRVKQGTDPADALLLACKRIRPDQTAAEPGPEPAEPSIENSVFKLVSTVASQDTPVQTHVREALSRPRLAHHALRPSQGSSQRIIRDLRSVKWGTRGEESYPILSSHRTGLSAEPPAPREMEAQENSAQTETSPGDILRVKQGTDPADALLLACKRIRPDQTAEPSIENSVFKLVATVASQDTPVQTHVREALSHPRLTHHALRPSQGSSQRIIGDLRSVKWSTRRDERYRILSSHRTGLSAEPPAPREMETQENSAQTETDTRLPLGDVQVFDLIQEEDEEDEKAPGKVRITVPL